MLNFLSSLSFSRFHLTIEARERISLPVYKGAVFRGAFGHAFRRIICVTRRTECEECIVQRNCLYAHVFETPVPAWLKGFSGDEAPHPFVIEPPMDGRTEFDPGDSLTLGLVLIGKTADFLPYFVFTFDEMGKAGLGRGRGKFALTDVQDVLDGEKRIYDEGKKLLSASSVRFDPAGDLPPSPSDTLNVQFLTPVRMKSKKRLVTPDAFDFRIFISQLHNRLFNLSLFHCGGGTTARRWKEEVEPVLSGVEMEEQDLHWYEWERYSGRQEARMKMGGLRGRVSFRGDLAPLWPLIAMGEHLHVGKGTSFGLGKYEVER